MLRLLAAGIVENFNPLRIAAEYEKNDAAAISILTDEKYFSGHKKYLTKIRSAVQLPLLRKDFIIDPYQIYESRVIGADAVLLIVRITGERLGEFLTLSRELGLAALTEVHTAAELKIALAAGADIIGINNRSLDTFITDIRNLQRTGAFCTRPETSSSRKALLPAEQILKVLCRRGSHAFLIGEALVISSDIGEKMRELQGRVREWYRLRYAA